MKKFIVGVAVLYLTLVIVGLLTGERGTKNDPEVRYIKGEVVRDTIVVMEPYFVSAPALPLFFYKIDTVTETQTVDSSAIIEDWILKRDYRQTVFDDTNGKLDIDLSVQYNQLQRLSYSFTPIHKEIVQRKEKVWHPFVSGSYSTGLGYGIGGGVFFRNVGFEYQLQNNNNTIGHLFGVKYKIFD